ncbi:MAG: hypothetical protein ACLPKI_20485 [Streptosporangiaceae bacterium]
MRGLKRLRSARILIVDHAFVQNLRRGHYDIATDVPDHRRLRIAFDDLATTIWPAQDSDDHALCLVGMAQRNSVGWAALFNLPLGWARPPCHRGPIHVAQCHQRTSTDVLSTDVQNDGQMTVR